MRTSKKEEKDVQVGKPPKREAWPKSAKKWREFFSKLGKSTPLKN